MKRVRANRRKPPKRELPKLPKLPALPRFAVNWPAVLAIVAAVGAGALVLGVGREVLELPLRQLEIEGSFQRVSSLEVEALVQPELDESFISLDLKSLRARILEIPWVDSVRVRRVWPDTLKISLTEHRAAARWGESGLLNTRGELFTEEAAQEYRELPRLAGPEGSHRRVADRYLRVREHIAGTSLTLDALEMDARGSFTIRFTGDFVVRIGRDDVDERIDRFFGIALRELSGTLADASYVDMRYAHGFAVGWREGAGQESTLARLDGNG